MTIRPFRPLAGLAIAVLFSACGSGDSKPAASAPPARPAPASTPTPAPAAPAPAESTWPVSGSSVGKIQFGWTVAELNGAIGEQLKPTYEVSDECDYLRPAALPAGVSLMIIKDTVVRVDVDSTGTLTREGAGIGDAEARIQSLYPGRVKVDPHKYTDGHYLTVSFPGDSRALIIFETDGQKVVSYHAGRKPYVEYVEGCS